MKFLCDQCKAKYQIADEKVQGKTLRMKCRKCGHVIEIRAITGDTKPSTVPPPGGVASGQTMQVDSLSDEAAAAALANPKIPQAPKNPFATRPAAGSPTKAAPPRPTTGAGGAPRPTGLGGGLLGGRADATGPRSPLAGSPTGTRPVGGRPEAPKKTSATMPPDDDNGPASALANAFNRSVTKKPELTNPSSSASTDPPAEEWYVAIDEVPVGPIRLTDLRAKYGVGNVTDDSLVWREGFEEWRPLRTLAELHELVREEVSQPRGSLMSGPTSK
ncbi:MAG: GYF domain-containing protein, partial [Polyangiales bacterium]